MSQDRAAREAFLDALVYDDPVQLYERAPCGYLSTTPDGVIVKCNATFRRWIGREAAEIVGQLSFVDLLTKGGRIYHETHYAPTLRMQGSVREIALDLVQQDGRRRPVLVNATLERDERGDAKVIRIAVFDATERRSYERELLRATEAAQDAELRATALARILQQAFIPPVLPTIPGLDLAAVYRPAGDGAEVGGDFYDVFPIGERDWVVVLGDVCGKGVEAAVVTALVRNTVRALAVDRGEPDQVLQRMNDVLLRHESQRFCTIALLRLRRDDEGWSVVHGTGGHPAPLLRTAGGTPMPWGGSGALIGVLDDPPLAQATRRLDPGDLLLLYTDGVTEGRRDREFFGDERVLAAIPARDVTAEEVIRVLLDEVLAFQDQVPRDDIAIVAVRVPPP